MSGGSISKEYIVLQVTDDQLTEFRNDDKRHTCWSLVSVSQEDCTKHLFLGRGDAEFFLSMSINRPLDVHHDDETFLDWTAKELAIRIVFELSEDDGYNLFNGQQEPLRARVFHYLAVLRGIAREEKPNNDKDQA